MGGVLAVVQGGKFGHGFASAGITKSFTNVQLAASGDGVVGGSIVAAAIGGTASAVTGGKFANGAQTAAFQFLFNAGVSAQKDYSEVTSSCSQEQCVISGYEPVLRMTGESNVQWHGDGSISWDELPLDPIVELIVRRPVLAMSFRKGTEYGHRVYEYERGFREYFTVVADLKVLELQYGNTHWTGATMRMPYQFDDSYYKRRRYQFCVGGSCE